MPLAPIPALATEAIATLRQWITGGALDASLTPSLSDAEIGEILND